MDKIATLSNIENVDRCLNKLSRVYENGEGSTVILLDMVNHIRTLMQCIEQEFQQCPH